ncbi:DNA cytosine methyltransferase [Paracerasibacillus soli]|uniref:DNA cytosine methyltransferase n=1 Tax=Paracerasibacillus soli TaxID=480284 RepID=A0ABU5CYW9_9BACI|nr:DNA cytosine methyltransferase [Virgibacillus soli]MDY0410665.1 DNA cytosine methyltransferase [Virgibacillus soli]
MLGDNYSISWRVLDAQYWGVPQRRKRIFLVADFNGRSASEILFESESLRGHFTQSKKAGQGTTRDTSKSSRETSNICLNDQGGSRMDVTKEVTATLRAKSNHPHLFLITMEGMQELKDQLMLPNRCVVIWNWWKQSAICFRETENL